MNTINTDRVRCTAHDWLPDVAADMGRGCIFYTDDHDPGPRCKIGDIPAHMIQPPEGTPT